MVTVGKCKLVSKQLSQMLSDRETKMKDTIS
jgi:hypothetical protein